jgi:serine/threonine protein kinase
MQPRPFRLQVALDVANGCHYLHRQKPMIVHRDLKSQNILLTRDGRCKIADFGLSKFFQQEVASMTGQIGEAPRASPCGPIVSSPPTRVPAAALPTGRLPLHARRPYPGSASKK